MAKVILITGISSGFGREMAKLLAEEGHSVYGTVRNEGKTTDGANILKMDLTDYESINKVVKTIVENEGRLDVLINNAGMHTGGPIETTPSENIRVQMDTNFIGMVHLTNSILPVMRKQDGGMIINISSIGGLMGLPFQAFYSASKFAVEGFSEALRMEVRKFNIKVVVINPGDFHTSNSANRRKFLAPGGPYSEQFEKSLSVIEKDESGGWDPGILAGKIAGIIKCSNPRQRYVVASLEQKLAVMLKRILPGKWFMRILASHYKID
jgi:short-subunit dehydrogenase